MFASSARSSTLGGASTLLNCNSVSVELELCKREAEKGLSVKSKQKITTYVSSLQSGQLTRQLVDTICHSPVT